VQYKFSRPSLSLGPTLRRRDYQFDGIIDFGHEIDTGAGFGQDTKQRQL